MDLLQKIRNGSPPAQGPSRGASNGLLVLPPYRPGPSSTAFMKRSWVASA